MKKCAKCGAEIPEDAEVCPECKEAVQAAGADNELHFVAAADGDPLVDEKAGYVWDVQVIKYGLAKNKAINWKKDVVVAALPLFNKARVFALNTSQHLSPDERKKRMFGKSTKELVGWLDNATDSGPAAKAQFHILPAAKWLRDNVVASVAGGFPELYGFSVDAGADTEKKMVAGRQTLEPQKITSIQVDVVYDPTNEGKFLKMVAAEAGDQEEDTMFRRLLAAILAIRPALAEQGKALEAKGDAVTEEEIKTFLTAAMPEQAPLEIDKLLAAMKDEGQGSRGKGQGAGDGEDTNLVAAQKILDQANVVAAGVQLTQTLSTATLPELSKVRLKKQFEGKAFKAEDLTAAIKDEAAYLDSLEKSGHPTGVGERIEVVGQPARLQAALDKLFGLEVKADVKDVVAFDGLLPAYAYITGDSKVRGIVDRRHMPLCAAIMEYMDLPAAYDSSAFSFLLGNSMFRRAIKIYNAVNYNEDALISFVRNAENFKTLEIINVGYFGDLPDVNPETGDYQEVSLPTDIEATYSPNQKGWIMSVTRRVMLNDDLKSVQQLLDKLMRAARRTHARRAWNKLISNADYKGDSKAVFHTDRTNLRTTGLTNDATGIATLTQALQDMFGQTERDSGETLGLEGYRLEVPRAILEIAKALNSSWPIAGTVNPHAGRFGSNHERINANPLFTDANDWYLLANPTDVEMLEAAYIHGRREPEVFVADNPAAGQMFTADKLQYKIRHEYEFEIADTPGFHKSVVG
jgi:hypothetical protein